MDFRHPLNADHFFLPVWGDLTVEEKRKLPLGPRQMALREMDTNYHYDGVVAIHKSDKLKYMIPIVIGWLANLFAWVAIEWTRAPTAWIMDERGGRIDVKYLDSTRWIMWFTKDIMDVVYLLRFAMGDETWLRKVPMIQRMRVTRIAHWFLYVGAGSMRLKIMRPLRTFNPYEFADMEMFDVYKACLEVHEFELSENLLGLIRGFADRMPQKALGRAPDNAILDVIKSPYTTVADEMNIFKSLVIWADGKIKSFMEHGEEAESLRERRRAILTQDILENVSFPSISERHFLETDGQEYFQAVFCEAELRQLECLYKTPKDSRPEVWEIGVLRFQERKRPNYSPISMVRVIFRYVANLGVGRRERRQHTTMIFREDLAERAASLVIHYIKRFKSMESAPWIDLTYTGTSFKGVLCMERTSDLGYAQELIIPENAASKLHWGPGVVAAKTEVLKEGDCLVIQTLIKICHMESDCKEDYVPVGYIMLEECWIEDINREYLGKAETGLHLQFVKM